VEGESRLDSGIALQRGRWLCASDGRGAGREIALEAVAQGKAGIAKGDHLIVGPGGPHEMGRWCGTDEVVGDPYV